MLAAKVYRIGRVWADLYAIGICPAIKDCLHIGVCEWLCGRNNSMLPDFCVPQGLLLIVMAVYSSCNRFLSANNGCEMAAGSSVELIEALCLQLVPCTGIRSFHLLWLQLRNSPL